MRRREFVGGAGTALVWPFEVRAQTAKIPRIGFLWFGSRGGPTPLSDGLKRAARPAWIRPRWGSYHRSALC